MRYMLAILLNGIAQIEYDRNVPLDTKQADYLNNMDSKMDAGIQVGEKFNPDPTDEQKTKYLKGSGEGS